VTQTVNDPQAAAPRQALSPLRRRRFVRSVALAVVVLGSLLLLWFAIGLFDAARAWQASAGEAQASLLRFRETLKVGDREEAERHLAAARSALDSADVAADRRQVRIASALPYFGSTVDDLDHLLVAARIMTTSATDALDVYRDVAGQDSTLFQNSAFSMPAIRRAQSSVADIAAAMDRAEAELTAVTGRGPKGKQALEKKASAMTQVSAVRAELVGLGPVLEILPAALGENGRKTYLVTVLNPAEMRASGGAPLSVAFIRFTDGRMTVPLKGQTFELTNGHQRIAWPRVVGDPWVGEGPGRFVNANANPDFRVAGGQLMQAALPHFGFRADGVIALDVVAISHLLEATGPIRSERYGRLTAKNVAQKLVVDAYQTEGQSDRHDDNDELMTLMLAKLTEGGGMIGKARALGQAVPGRHLQMHFRDDGLQQLVEDERSAGAVAAPQTGDLAAVYTQNGNSKVDVFQHRTVKETIRLREDGSARVRRTVVIENRTSPYVGPGTDPQTGYHTRWARIKVMNVLPPGAQLVETPADREYRNLKADQAGRPYVEEIITIPPTETFERTLVYDVPRAAVRDGRGLRLLAYVETQPLLVDPMFELTVIAPDGWSARPGQDGWKVTEDRAAIRVPMSRARLLQLTVAP
jgi:hypothetical protein